MRLQVKIENTVQKSLWKGIIELINLVQEQLFVLTYLEMYKSTTHKLLLKASEPNFTYWAKLL